MRKNPAAIVKVAVAGWILVFSTAGCGPEGSPGDLERELSEALSSPARRTEPVAITEVADFEWDRLVFLCPYDSESEADKRLGFSWDAFPGQLDDEGRSMFVFVGGDAVAQWAYVSRAVADPCGEETARVVERDAASFVVEEPATDGSPVLRQHP